MWCGLRLFVVCCYLLLCDSFVRFVACGVVFVVGFGWHGFVFVDLRVLMVWWLC